MFRSKCANPPPDQAAPANPFANQNKVPGVKRVIAVASGKGGVGKSTCSVNLACALDSIWARKSACWIATFTGRAFR